MLEGQGELLSKQQVQQIEQDLEQERIKQKIQNRVLELKGEAIPSLEEQNQNLL